MKSSSQKTESRENKAIQIAWYFVWCTFLLAGINSLSSCAKQDGEAAKTEASKENSSKEVVKEKPQYYKVKNVELGASIDAAMAKNGTQIFDVTCTGCHKYDEKYVGPALGDVTKRRTPEYIMNMILDTETMIEKDDTVKCMLQTYLMKMPNMQVDEKDARSVLEHLREVGQKK
ncbi:MAG: c-type cytochrome [Candidatus Kapabacteria bacterium]|nr:c-type cytochrome [Candidatus Kapabacteria bacterium]